MGNQVFFIIWKRVNKNKFDSEEQKIRSVVDSYLASYIELCEFESQQGRFLQMFFLYIYYSFTY